MFSAKTAIGLLAAGSLMLAACSSGGSNSTDSGPTQKGGTLRLAGPEEIGNLDPATGYGPADLDMQHAINRNLFGYPTTKDEQAAINVAPDIATELPTKDNGGISADGKTYTIKMKNGVKWHAPGGDREVVAADVVLGVKRMCNPKLGSPVVGYYTDTIEGLADYCTQFAKVQPTVAAMKEFMGSHDIAGVSASDAKTVVFKLTQPASDFLSILALGSFAAPQPAEYLEYLPDSPEMRTHTVSDGPYLISKYVQGQSFTLERNPAWDASTDPLRKAYVDRIEIKAGQDDSAISQQIKAGTVDMQWGDAVTPSSEIAGLQATKDDRLVIAGAGTLLPYLTFNYLSPNNGNALTKLKVRQALNYAVNKAAIVQVLGGPSVAKVTGQILPPEIVGYQKIDPYNTPDDKGDPAKAKQLLAEAGYPNGLTLKMLYRNDGSYPNISTVLQQDLAKAGIKLEMRSMSRNTFYQNYLQNPDATKRGEWDIAPVGWSPDYLGNAARGFFIPLLDGRKYAKGSPNYGDYNNDQLNSVIDQALATTDPKEAATVWAQADKIASEDAAWVPIARTQVATLHSSRVKNFVFVPGWHNGDMTNVSLGADRTSQSRRSGAGPTRAGATARTTNE